MKSFSLPGSKTSSTLDPVFEGNVAMFAANLSEHLVRGLPQKFRTVFVDNLDRIISEHRDCLETAQDKEDILTTCMITRHQLRILKNTMARTMGPELSEITGFIIQLNEEIYLKPFEAQAV